MKIIEWFKGIKWVRNNVKGVKAVYYKKELLVVRVNDTLPTNYYIAKKIFEGFFGYSTYCCDDLMLSYKLIDTKIDEDEYTKLTSSLRHLGFNLYFSTRDDGKYMVGLFADQNIMQYVTDKSLRLDKFNIEMLSYIT
jgi:hypothetical protein